MKPVHTLQRGFSLIELLVAMTIGLFLVGAVISLYLVQTQQYRSASAQGSIQNTENAITMLVEPIVRAAGFSGCATSTQSLSALMTSFPPPLGTLTTTPSMVMGYNANGNSGSSGLAWTMSQNNSPNSSNSNDWSPALSAPVLGLAQAGSDVLVVLGAAPGSIPMGVTAPPTGTDIIMQQFTTEMASAPFAAISDCLKATVFQVTGSNAGTKTISHDASINATIAQGYSSTSQVVPLQQTTFYIAQGPGDQSTLMQGNYLATGGWVSQPLAVGVDSMQIMYGINTNGAVSQYVTANNVTDWSQVGSVRLGFLLQGESGSGLPPGATPSSYSVLGTTITVPADGRLRHVYELTIDMRNIL